MWKRKYSLKQQYGTLAHFLRGDEDCHYLGQRYIEGTNIYARREWRGVKDTARDFAFWLHMWLNMAGLVMASPVRTAKAFWKYRWMSIYLTAPHWKDKWTAGDRGMTLKADLAAIDAMFLDSVDVLKKLIRADRQLGGETKWTRNTLPIDYTLPQHIFYGFPELMPININQHTAFMVPMLRMELGPYYVDVANDCGIPQGMCTLPLVEVGVAMENEMPDVGDCWIPSNCACDANMLCNTFMYRVMSNEGRKAVHSYASAMRYDDPSTREYEVHELYKLISFLEGYTGHPFDWDAFIRATEITNQLTREELDRWDVYARSDNGPLNGVCQGLFRIYAYQQGANKNFIRGSRKTWEVFKKCVERDIKPFPKARHRAIAWSCGSTYYCHGVAWLYNCWGIVVVNNMDSLTGHNIVDTSNEAALMNDMADWYVRTPMRTHTTGGNRHLMQMWETAEKFNCDMIVMYDDIGCKGMAGAQGLLEEEFHKRRDKINIMWFPHGLMDYRIMPPAQARRVVNDYMTTVMHEEPLDPSLLDYDDTAGW